MLDRIPEPISNTRNKRSQSSDPSSLTAAASSPSALQVDLAIHRKASCSCGGRCPSCQDKSNLNVSRPNDPTEIEADQIADRVMRKAGSRNVSTNATANTIQPKHDSSSASEAFGDNSVGRRIDSVRGGGNALDGGTRSFMESRFGTDFSGVRVHQGGDASDLNRELDAKAFTVGNDIYFRQGEYSPTTEGGQHLIAHELAHVVQHRRSSSRTPRISRQPASPQDKTLVEQAKKRLEKLEPALAELEGKKLEADREKNLASLERRTLDENSADAGWKAREEREEDIISKLNRRPLRITVTNTDILFEVKFQFLFHDPKKKQPEKLTDTLTKAIKLVWDQTLSSGIFKGRTFRIVPQIETIDSLKDRNHDSWLIEVRKSDKELPVTHPGCTFEQPSPGLPTSITDATCDGGVMNLPPLHVSMPGIVGHEMLHLFGLVDRYIQLSEMDKAKKKVIAVTLVPSREIGDRKDPLGGDDATIIREDLNYLFLELGVYDKEISKTDALVTYLKGEIRRLRDIVDAGGNPNSLLPIRKDFRDKIIKSVEDLP